MKRPESINDIEKEDKAKAEKAEKEEKAKAE
jgi:hypothetical protein